MKTELEVNEDIFNLIMKISDHYPELSKYIIEMPITIPNIKNPQINLKHLLEYYNSLSDFFQKYAFEHSSI